MVYGVRAKYFQNGELIADCSLNLIKGCSMGISRVLLYVRTDTKTR